MAGCTRGRLILKEKDRTAYDEKMLLEKKKKLPLQRRTHDSGISRKGTTKFGHRSWASSRLFIYTGPPRTS